MYYIKFLYADGAAEGGGTGKAKPVSTPAIPAADIDLMDVSRAVADAWLANPQIALVWKTSAEFSTEVRDFTNTLYSRNFTGSLRPGFTQTLQQLDQQIDAAVGEVKIYIAKKYKKANAAAQYARFGIVREHGGRMMNRDRNQRKAALQLMVTAIDSDGFAREEYGSAFWTDMLAQYTAAMNLAGNTAGDVSEKVATKNVQKRNIIEVLKALQLVLMGNYPETYREIFRKWGWKKENY